MTSEGAYSRHGVKGAQTASRALELLELVATSERPLTISDLTRVTGLTRSVVSRALLALEDRGLVTRPADSHGYVQGVALIALASKVLNGIDIRRVAHPILLEAAESSGETVSLHIKHLNFRVCVDSVEGIHPVRRIVPPGETLPLTSGPTGKVVLAALSDEEVQAILEWSDLPPGVVKSLWGQLAEIRHRGYMSAAGDRIPDVGAVSVSVSDGSGPVAAITVSGPAARFCEPVREQFAPYLVERASSLSKLLGRITE